MFIAAGCRLVGQTVCLRPSQPLLSKSSSLRRVRQKRVVEDVSCIIKHRRRALIFTVCS
jgi:hypothetical protein